MCDLYAKITINIFRKNSFEAVFVMRMQKYDSAAEWHCTTISVKLVITTSITLYRMHESVDAQ